MANFILAAFADEAGKDIKTQIEAMKANNITHLEPRGLDHGNISTYTPQMAKELKKILDDNGIGISALGSPFGKIGIKDDFKEHFELFKANIENANILGTKNIRIFSFYFKNGESYDEYRDEVLERLNKFVEYSNANGIMCCHENEKGIYGDNEIRCLDIAKSLDGKIKLVFDPGNFIQCGVDIIAAYKLLEPYIEYLHVKDGLYVDGSIVPCGKGEANYVELFRLIDKKDWDIILTLEPHLKVFKGLEELEQPGGSADTINNFLYPSNKAAFEAAANALHDTLKIALGREV